MGNQVKVNFVKTYSLLSDLGVLLIGTNKGLFLSSENGIKLLDQKAKDGVVCSEGQIFVLRENAIYLALPKEGQFLFEPLNAFTTLDHKIVGLIDLPTGKGKHQLGIRTENGLLIYQNHYFDEFKLPFQWERPPENKGSDQFW